MAHLVIASCATFLSRINRIIESRFSIHLGGARFHRGSEVSLHITSLSFSRSEVVSRSQFSCRHPINLFNYGFISPQWWPKIFKWGFGFTNQFLAPSKEPNFSFDGNCVSLCGTFSRFVKRSLVVVRIQERDFVFQKRIAFLALNSYPTAYWSQRNIIRSLFSWPAFRCCDESCKQMKYERIHEALNMKLRKISRD